MLTDYQHGVSIDAQYRGDVGDHVTINLNFTPTITPAQHAYTKDGIHTVIYRELRYERTESGIESSFAIEELNSGSGQLSARIVQNGPRGPNAWVGGLIQFYADYWKMVSTWGDGRSETEWHRTFEFIVSVAVNY